MPVGEFRLRSVAVSAFGPTVLAAVGHGAVLPVLALRARELGASVQTAAFVVGLLGVGALLSSLPAGSLVDRVGERTALMLAGVVDAAAMAASAVAGTVAALSVAVFVSGAAWTVFLLARQAYMIDAVPERMRARALSSLGGSHRIGLFVGPLIGAAVIARWGIGGPFVLACVAALGAAGLALTIPDVGAQHRAQRSERLSVLAVLAAHRHVLLTLGTSVMVISATRGIRGTLLPLWADHVGLSAQDTSLIFGIAAAVDMALFYPAGWVMDRFGRVWIAVPCVAVMAIGFTLLPSATGFAAVTAVAVLIAVGNGIGSGIVMTLAADSAPVQGRAQFLGAWRLCGDVGNTAGPFLVSALAALATLGAACVLTGGISLAGAAWSGYWVARLDRRRRRPVRA